MKFISSVNLKRASQDGWRKVAGSSILGISAHIVPRSICRFERIWVPRTDAKGVEAATLLARNESKERKDLEVYVAPGQDTGPGYLNAWIWRREHVDAGSGRSVNLFIPESLAQERSGNSTRIVECLEGFEGQVWEENQLKASRWWRTIPTERDWREFISGAEVVSDIAETTSSTLMAVPEVEAVNWRSDISWGDINPEALTSIASPQRLLIVLALCLALPFGYLAGSWVHLSRSNVAVERQLTDLRLEVGDVLNLRQAALANKLELERLSSMGNPIELVDILNELRAAMETSDIEILGLDYDSESLEVRFTAEPDLSLPSLATKLESSPDLDNVSANIGSGGLITLKATLQPAS